MNRHLLTVLLTSLAIVPAVRAGETEPENIQQVVAVKNVCAWPNLTLLRDGTVVAVLFNQPAHGTQEGDIECWASRDGLQWEKRSVITRHEPDTVRMNHAAGLATNGDLVVLCSGWSNIKQPQRPKQAPFRDDILRPWTLRSSDGGRTWEKRDDFPAAEAPWSEFIPFGDIWTGEDGALHTSCYQGEYADPTKSTKTKGWRSWHFRSDDDGRTWKAASIIGARHNETDIFPLGGKSWLAAARIDRMELIRSDDDGATWQTPQPVTEPNEINAHLIRLKDGRLLLSYGVRINDRRGVCAKLSSDDGKTWSEPLRLAHAGQGADCGYPASVQLPDGKIVTAWYASKSPGHDGYHMGATVWTAPAVKPVTQLVPTAPVEFAHAGIVAVWQDYADRLSFGKGQTLALVDDGCKPGMPEWTATVNGVPKVRVSYDAVDGDDDPRHEGRGYHGSTIGVPSSLNYGTKRGVAYNNQVAIIRGLECCHCKTADSKTLAAALQWVIDNHKQHRITTVNLAPVDDLEHGEPVPTEIDEKLAELRKLGVWVSAPAGNHRFSKGISWPACQPNCFAIGATKPGKDVIHLDRHQKIDLLVPAAATSSSNAILCGAVMLLREAIETTGYDWKAHGDNLPEAMLAMLQQTGHPVTDPVSGLTFRRLDLRAAMELVFGTKRE